MNRLDYTDPKNVQQTIADFTSLLQTPGWKLLEDIVLANIEEIKNQLLSGSIPGEDMDMVKRLRDKIDIHKAIIETPRRTIKQLEPKDKAMVVDDDPYFKMPEEKLAEIPKV